MKAHLHTNLGALLKQFLCLMMLGLWINLAGAPALFQNEPDVRVRIINTLDTLRITLNGDWVLMGADSFAYPFPDGQQLLIIKQDDVLVLKSADLLQDSRMRFFWLEAASASATVGIAGVPFGVGWWWGGVEDRIYEGRIHVYLDSQKALCVTIQLPLEEYLKGVVPYEIGGKSPGEALKAQAVAARSEAIIALTSKLYSGEQHDLTADVECQVFSGNHRRTSASDQAVEDTHSLVLSEGGQTINAFYASNCGGHAELIKNVWPGRNRASSYQAAHTDNADQSPVKLNSTWRMRCWLKRPPQVYCNPAFESALPSWSQTNFRWSRKFSRAEITKMVSGNRDLGSLKRIKALRRGDSGRIYQARFIFARGSFDVDGELAIRQLFSPSLRSSAFIVKKRWGSFVLEGAGWGHGVGMCQSGAIAMASHGSSFKEILKHYYSQTELLPIYDSPDWKLENP